MKRWYDKHKKLSKLLEGLKPMRANKRDTLCTAIIEIIKEYDDSLIDNEAMEFPLDLPQRRWYDKDPCLWLIFNSLSLADNKLLRKVTTFLAEHIT